MKKFIITLCVAMCAASASAQTFASAVTSSDNWAVGLRIGSGFQAQAEYVLPSQNYIEGRFGMSWLNGGAALMADFTALHNWHLADMDWTPSTGNWFVDAGCGVVVGGREHYAYVGAAGSVKFGIKFHNSLKLAVDWTPFIGPEIAYYKGNSAARFNEYGFANFGISCVYCF